MESPIKDKVDKIKEYYEKKVKDNKGKSVSSMPDAILIDKETELILSYINDGDFILDVGCANGYSTMKYAMAKKCHAKGIDFSDSMIKDAKEEADNIKDKIKLELQFEVGDVSKLKEKDSQFDKVISKRCIINLPSWDLQKKALSELGRVLKQGGEILMSEASRQGWENMNKLRKEFNLNEIPQPWFNLYLDDDKLTAFMKENNMEVIEILNFSSTYYIGSRVLQPFIIGKDKEPRYDSEINRLFSMLPNCGDYGTQKLYHFRKKNEKK